MLLLVITVIVAGLLAWVISKSMTTAKRILCIAASVLGATFVVWVVLWVQLFTCFPAEHVYVTSFSPDGKKVARFSVQYEGIGRWIPDDIEPQYYVTIVDTTYGRVLLRKKEFHGTVKASFSELAGKYAPWAVTELDSVMK